MGDLGLADTLGRGHSGDPDRDEAVHLTEEGDLLDHLGAIDLEAAAVVVQGDPGDLSDQCIGHLGGQFAHDQRILALTAPALQEIQVACEQLLDHTRDVGRVVLQITVQGCDQLAAGCVEAGLHGRGLTEVAPQPDHPNVRAVTLADLAQTLARAVAAAVVHTDQLPGASVIRKPFMDPLQHRLDVVDLLIHGDDDGERRMARRRLSGRDRRRRRRFNRGVHVSSK